MRLCYVYEHWRPDKEECFYVGKGTGGRAFDLSRNAHHRSICAKLSRAGMCAEVRLVAAELTSDEAFDLEVERIAFWRSQGIRLANKDDGGKGRSSGYKQLKKTKAKIKASVIAAVSEKMKGNKRALGYKHTDQAMARMSAAAKNNKRGRANRGRELTEEWKNKIRASMLILAQSPQWKSSPPSWIGRKHTKEARFNMIEAWKKRRAAADSTTNAKEK